jgi:hypothetical protein
MRKLILTSLLFLAAFSTRLELAAASNATVSVRDGATSQQIQARTPAHQELQSSVARNQVGWSRYYATNPSGGVLTSDGSVTLQFVGNSVLMLKNGQKWTKPVQASEYQFLRTPIRQLKIHSRRVRLADGVRSGASAPKED